MSATEYETRKTEFSHIGSLLVFLLLLTTFLHPLGVAAQVLPDDPFISQQWGWLRVAADKALAFGYNGSEVIVAVLDTGADLDHPDLAENLIEGWNFVDNNQNVSDLDNHGTMVAGIIAAVANNSEGLAGVAPEAKIMPLKVIDEDGGDLRDISSAIRYAADNGASVISMSFAGEYSRFSQTVERALDYAANQGCILVAAVGNDNTDELVFPAAYEEVIAVSAIDENDTKAEISNYGSYVDFCAPGINVVSTGKDGNYLIGNGTSFSAPFVTGLVALMLADNPQLTAEEARTKLRLSAEDLGEEGWDQYYGWGLANAYCVIPDDSIPEFSSWTMLTLIVTVTTIMVVFRKRKLDTMQK